MAMMAKADMSKRIVHVNRKKLLETLTANREQHQNDYEKAMEGYIQALKDKVAEGFEGAKNQLEKRQKEITHKLDGLTQDDIPNQQDYFTVVDRIVVEMRVPKSYSEAYDSAIALAEYDVRDILELSMAEVNCFMRNQWDWTREFEVTNSLYSAG